MLDLTVPMVEVWLAGAKLGEYGSDLEALKAASAHADTLTAHAPADVEYEIRREAMKYIVHRRIVGPDAPALGPVLTISSTALTLTLDRPASGPTTIDRYEIEQLVGSTWTQIASGLSIFGSTDEYAVTGLIASTAYSFRCRAVDTTERASEYSYATGTTSAGAGNSAPVWVSGTLSKTVQAGSSVTITSTDCSDPEGDPLAFTLLDTNPNDATITVSAGGIIQTTASTPVGINSIIVRASDGLLTKNKTIQLTVTAAATGNTFYIGTGVPTYDAAAAGVQPGDTIVISRGTGTRGPLVIQNAVGTAAAHINIIPDPTGTVTIRRSSPSATGFVLRFKALQYVDINGYRAGATRSCGLKVMYATNSVAGTGTANKDGPSCWIKYDGQMRHVSIQYVEVDGGFVYSNSADDRGIGYGFEGIGIQGHDNLVLAASGKWQENLTFSHMYVHNTAGEGFYIGPNFTVGAIPLRNIEVSYNYVANCGGGAIQGKCWFEGTNSMHHNEAYDCGNNAPTPQRSGIVIASGTGSIYNNIVFREASITNKLNNPSIGGNPSGIQFYIYNGPAASTLAHGYYGPYTSFEATAYNNLVVDVGNNYLNSNGQSSHGITIGTNTTLKHVVSLYNNTIVNASDTGIIVNAALSGSFVRNNIAVANGQAQVSASAVTSAGGTVSDNTTTGTPAALFAETGVGNYRLSAEIAAAGTYGTHIAATDLDDVTRSATYSRGAYEYA